MNPISDLDANPSEYPRVGRETNACGFQKQGWRGTHGLRIIGNGFWGITPYYLLPMTWLPVMSLLGKLLPNMLLYRPAVE